MCFVSGYTQRFYGCYRLHSGILQMCVCVCVTGYTEGFNRCFVYVLQVTLRVSTGVFVCVCCRLHSGFLQVFCVPGLYSKDHRESK